MPLKYVIGDPERPKGHATFCYILNGIPHFFYAGGSPADLPISHEIRPVYEAPSSTFSPFASREIPEFVTASIHLSDMAELEKLKRTAVYRCDDVIDLGELDPHTANDAAQKAVIEYVGAYKRALKSMKLL